MQKEQLFNETNLRLMFNRLDVDGNGVIEK
jgi:hypothetical protein